MVQINNYSTKKLAQIFGSNVIFNDFIINKITLDSREITKNNACFFAIKGKNYDGHNYINEAVKNGANLIIAERKIDTNVPVIYVENTIKALGKLAHFHKGKTRAIGVTGSIGKTTTKDMIFSVLKEKYTAIATEGNFNNEIGVPLTLLRLKNEDFVVVEMGMRALGEIDYLASISSPETSIITNALTSHIEKLKTKENIFLAKKEILNHTRKYAIFPNEERFKSIDTKGVRAFFVGSFGDVFISNYEYTNQGIRFSINYNNKITNPFELMTFSKHNLTNALFAYQVGKIYNLSDDEIREGLKKYKSTKMHEEYLKINGITIINDCYNASIESVKSAIDTLNQYCRINNKRMNVLLADVKEAGDESEKIHFEIGRFCKKQGVSKLFTYGSYAKNVMAGFCGGYEFKLMDEIAGFIMKKLNKDDVLLVKGSRGMHLEKIIEEMKEYSDE